MATKKPIEIKGVVRGGEFGGSSSWVYATVLDLEPANPEPDYDPLVLCRTRSDEGGVFTLPIPDWLSSEHLGRDGSAPLLLHALSGFNETGATMMTLVANQPVEPQVIELGAPGVVPAAPPIGAIPAEERREPQVVQFSPEVLDALVGAGGGGGGGGASSATPAVLDDRFFEERLRRMVGANVRSGDIAGLRREIDRVVVEEVVEGETQFVFRGPGSTRPGRAGATSGSAAQNGRASGYASANGSGGYGMSKSGDSLAGGQAILYRRTVAEIDYVREALASLQPVDPLESPQFEAVRGLVGDGLTDLLEAFGSTPRPPVARVNGVFEDLLDTDNNESTIESLVCNPQRLTLQVFGFIGELGRQAGLLSRRGCPVNDFIQTVADDLAVTRFNELATFVISLRTQWNGFRGEFEAAFREPTLTSLGAILGRRLGLVADATRELDLAIETAPGDSGERYFTPIGNTGTTLDEFLAWLNGYIDDSREQLRDTSRIGMRGIGSEATRLAGVAAAGVGAGANDDTIIGRRLVQRALEELQTNLEGIAEAVRNGR